MTANTNKKNALVILTNEAFLPKGGRGRFRSFEGQQWATVHDPAEDPNNENNNENENEDELEQAFTRTHRLTGIDALEVGYFWLTLRKHLNMNVTFCSPRGGAVAVDPSSFEMAERDEKLQSKIRNDKEFMAKLTHTYPIKWIDPTKFDLCLIPGRHGALFDLPECRTVEECIEQIWQNDGYVCAIGHGVAALLNVKSSKHGEYFLKNKRVTCFTNAEEKEKRFDDFLPYSLEEKVKERGAHLDNTKPYTPHVVVDKENRVITAQSSPSIKEFMKRICETCTTSQGKNIDMDSMRWD